MTDQITAPEWIAQLQSQIGTLFDLSEIHDLPLAELVAWYVAVDSLAKDVATFKDGISQALYEAMPTSTMVVEGVGVLERKSGAKRKNYDGALLLSNLASRLSDEAINLRGPDGETPPLAAVVEMTANTVAAATGATAPSFAGWRSGKLKELGINPNDYCEWVEGRPTVIVRAAS